MTVLGDVDGEERVATTRVSIVPMAPPPFEAALRLTNG